MLSPMDMRKLLDLSQKIPRKIYSFRWFLMVYFISYPGLSQRYFFPSPNLSSTPMLSRDSLAFSFPGNLGFFEHFRTEMELERFLILNLSSYVDQNRFFVSVKYNPGEDQEFPNTGPSVQDPGVLEGAIPPNNPNNSTSESYRPPINRLPVLPDFWRRNSSGEALSSDSNTASGSSTQGIGMPDRRVEDSLLQEQDGESFLLGKLSVHFIIDPEITPEVEGLMGKVAFYALKLYAFESYEITFERIPLNDLFSKNPEKSDLDSMVLMLDQKSAIDQQLKTDMENGFKEWITPWALLFFLLLITLIGIVLFLLWKIKPFGSGRERESNNLEKSLLRSVEQNFSEKSPSQQVPVLEDLTKTEPIQADFHEYFVRNTQEIGKVFSHWIQDLREEGLLRVHTILMPMGKNMYNLIDPYLSKIAKEKLLQSFSGQVPPTKPENRQDYLDKLMEIISHKLGIDSLAILDSLEKEELFTLLDLLGEQDAAKVLYHMDSILRSEYFQRSTQFRSAEILFNVSSIRSMDKNEYERLGELLSEKLVELRFFKKHANKEVQFLLDSLDALDLDVQEIILENLETTDPVLYEKISKYQLAWGDIPTLDQDLVRNATLGFTPNELSIVYQYRPFEVSSIILLRPERERELIFELATQKREVSNTEAKAIMKRMLSAIKTKLRTDEK